MSLMIQYGFFLESYIYSVSGGIVYILGGGSMDYSE